jgi:membrane fusion protein (multidrug efflux system)
LGSVHLFPHIFRRKRFALSSALLATSVALTIACGRAGEGGDDEKGSFGPPQVTVEVTTIQPQLLIDTVALTGQLEAEHSVLLKPEIDGVVSSVDFVEGQPVSKGEVLVRLRDEMQRARVKEAEAALRLEQQVVAREDKLQRRDASSLARIEDARAKLDGASARLRLAEIELARTRIRAPFDGVPGVRLVSPGSTVEERDGLAQFDAIDKLQVIFTVTENAISLARVGGTIYVRVAAWGDEQFPGTVFFVSPTVDPATRRLILKAWVPNPGHRLKPGMFANVDVQIAERENALMVPEAAMIYDRNGTYVWRMIEEDRAEKVPVTIGLRTNGAVEILEGIEPGDAVVSAGTHKVMAGKKLTVAGGVLAGAATGARKAAAARDATTAPADDAPVAPPVAAPSAAPGEGSAS